MPIATLLQPDQDAARWDSHVDAYEQAFEPLTDQFAARALDLLEPLAGARLLDVAAGAGGAALQAAQRGAQVTAVDASAAMTDRIRQRAGASVRAVLGDGAALAWAAETFDLALSSFGVVLLPDPACGMAEMHRVLRPGGRVAVVTWTEPHRYALAARLGEAIAAVRGAPVSPGALPAQLRFTDPARLHDLVADAGFAEVEVHRVEAALTAASARALAAALAFAPGMAATLDALAGDRDAVAAAFAARLEADQGFDAVSLPAIAHIAVGRKAMITAGRKAMPAPKEPT